MEFHMFFFRQQRLLLSAIFLLATALRLSLLFTRGDFWFDETFSVHFSTLPWHDFFRFAILETNPPIFTAFLRGFLKIVQTQSEWIIRLPSVVFGLATVILVSHTGKKMFNRTTGLLAALLLSLSGIHIFVSTETRVYSLLGLIAIASVLFFYTVCIEERATRASWAILAGVNALLIFSHLSALLLIAMEFFALVLIRPSKKTIRTWVILHSAIGALWLTWFVPSLISKMNAGSASAWFLQDAYAREANLMTIPLTLFASGRMAPFVSTCIIILAILGVAVVLRDIKKIHNIQQTHTLVLLFATGVFPLIIGSLLGVYITKYYLIALPSLALLAGYAITAACQTKQRLFFGTSILFLILLPPAFDVAHTRVFSLSPIIARIEANATPSSLIITDPFNERLTLSRYYHGPVAIEGLYLGNDSYQEDERIVRYNWMRKHRDEKSLAEWLDRWLSGKEKIFYLQYTNELGTVPNMLGEKGWTIYGITRAHGHINLYVFEFHAPENN